MSRVLGLSALLVLLVACTPADVEYCRGFGVEGTVEYGQCIRYFHQQQQAFAADRDVCELEADGTYPPSLYDHGSYGHSMGGFDSRGNYYGGQTIRIDPDWQHNREVDRLRMRIIEPCMRQRGWKSGSEWQAGRQKPAPQAKSKAKAAPLPWLQ